MLHRDDQLSSTATTKYRKPSFKHSKLCEIISPDINCMNLISKSYVVLNQTHKMEKSTWEHWVAATFSLLMHLSISEKVREKSTKIVHGRNHCYSVSEGIMCYALGWLDKYF